MEATATVNGILYRMGCQPSTMCSAQGLSPRIVSRFIEQPEQTNCHECCPGNLCNDHLCTRSIIRDCSDLLNSGRSWPSGVYTMDTWQTHTLVDVFCDMDTDGGGWTVFQHRVDGSLRYLNEITSRRKNTLRIELQTPNATRLYDVYEEFSVGPGSNYTLHDEVGSTYLFSPYHDGMAFTTYDHDMDQSSVSNCANDYHGAWWYKSCYNANLNGQYFVPGTHNGTGITYNSFKFLISLKENALKCYSCQNIKTPSKCNQTQKCTSGQVCSAQGHSPGIVGRFIEQPEQTTCHECCPGNLCNDHLYTRSI
ncbi:FBCDB-like protein, partial [Mya arenaria]